MPEAPCKPWVGESSHVLQVLPFICSSFQISFSQELICLYPQKAHVIPNHYQAEGCQGCRNHLCVNGSDTLQFCLPEGQQPKEEADLRGLLMIITKMFSTGTAKCSPYCQLLELEHVFVSPSVFGRALRVFSSILHS